MSDKFPLRIHRVEDGTACRFKAATAMEKIVQSPVDTRQSLHFVELDYEVTITAAKTALTLARQNGRVDAQVCWLAAKALNEFSQRLNEAGFYLSHRNATLARDLGISESSTKKMLSFQRRFRNIFAINPKIPWERYRNIKVPLANA